VWDRIEVVGQVSVNHVGVPPGNVPVHFLDCVHRPARGTIAVSTVLEINLEDWFQHELGGSLNDSIPDRWNAERSLASFQLPQMAGGSASALSLSRPARASLTLRPVGSLSRPRRPLSRGSSSVGYPTEPLVSFQTNRQLSGWHLPPLMIRAFGAHGQEATSRPPRSSSAFLSATY
jgi:hypothetical protein